MINPLSQITTEGGLRDLAGNYPEPQKLDPNINFKRNLDKVFCNQIDDEAIAYVADQLKLAQRRTSHGDVLKERIKIILNKIQHESGVDSLTPSNTIPKLIFREILRASQQMDLSGIIEVLISTTKFSRDNFIDLLNSAEQNHTATINILCALSKKGQSNDILYSGKEAVQAVDLMFKEVLKGSSESRSRLPEHAFNFICSRIDFLKKTSEINQASQPEYNQALISFKIMLSELSNRPLHRLYNASIEKIAEHALIDLSIEFLKRNNNKFKSWLASFRYKSNPYAQIAYLLKADTPEYLKNSWLVSLRKIEDPILTKILTPKRLKALCERAT